MWTDPSVNRPSSSTSRRCLCIQTSVVTFLRNTLILHGLYIPTCIKDFVFSCSSEEQQVPLFTQKLMPVNKTKSYCYSGEALEIGHWFLKTFVSKDLSQIVSSVCAFEFERNRWHSENFPLCVYVKQNFWSPGISSIIIRVILIVVFVF